MSKVVDITEKLEFGSNPILKIGTIKAEVNADAETVLRLMGVISEGGDMRAALQALNLIFKPEDVEAICGLKKDGKKLSIKSLMVIIQAAMNLVMDEDDQGEDQTHTTT